MPDGMLTPLFCQNPTIPTDSDIDDDFKNSAILKLQGDLGASLEITDLLKYGAESAEFIALHHHFSSTSFK